jgi:hypothetical protein
MLVRVKGIPVCTFEETLPHVPLTWLLDTLPPCGEVAHMRCGTEVPDVGLVTGDAATHRITTAVGVRAGVAEVPCLRAEYAHEPEGAGVVGVVGSIGAAAAAVVTLCPYLCALLPLPPGLGCPRVTQGGDGGHGVTMITPSQSSSVAHGDTRVVTTFCTSLCWSSRKLTCSCGAIGSPHGSERGSLVVNQCCRRLIVCLRRNRRIMGSGDGRGRSSGGRVRAHGTRSGMGHGESGRGGLAVDLDVVGQGVLTAARGTKGGISEPLGDGVFLCEINDPGPRSSQSSCGGCGGLSHPSIESGVVTVRRLDVEARIE